MSSLEDFIFQAVFHCLTTSTTVFQWTLLPLSRQQLEELTTMTREGQDRLEWLGDLVIDHTLGSLIRDVLPHRGRTFYAPIERVLVRNKTFAALWINAGAPREDVLADPKAYADYFEVIVALFARDQGLAPIHAWVKRTFLPLIVIAHQAFSEYSETHSNRSVSLLKRPSTGPPASVIPPSKKPRRDADILGEVTNLVPVASSSRALNTLPAFHPTTPTKPKRALVDAAISPMAGVSRYRPIDLTGSP